MSDPSNAQVRTTFAWQRTAFALGALAVIAIKLAMINHQIIGVIAAIVALIGAALLYVSGRIQLKDNNGPFMLLLLSTFIVAALSVATIVQII